MRTRLACCVSTIALSLAPQFATAQISVTGGGFNYNQDFDSLIRATTAEGWTDNANTVSGLDAPRQIGLAGWYAASFTNAATTFFNTTYSPLIRGGDGGSGTGSFYSYGPAANADRAFGTLPSDSTTSAGAGALRLGVRFVNNTGTTISGFNFSYDGEQWRKGTSTAINNQFAVGYAIFSPGSGNLATPFYTALAAANFNTPNDGDGVGAALNGNDPINRIAGISDTVTALSVAPGDEIWLRWSDANSSGGDHGMGIDNFSITFAVPEPTTATLFGIGLACLVNRIRRK